MRGDILLIEEREPCLVIVSIHPPSIVFCMWAPEERGNRDEACAFIGVVNIKDVIASVILGLVLDQEVLIKALPLRAQPIKSPEDIAKSASSFKDRGRVTSLSGRTMTQNKEGATQIVAWAKLIMGVFIVSLILG